MNEEDPKRKRGRPEKRLKIDEEPEEALQKLFQPKDEAGDGEAEADGNDESGEDSKDPGDSADK